MNIKKIFLEIKNNIESNCQRLRTWFNSCHVFNVRDVIVATFTNDNAKI